MLSLIIPLVLVNILLNQFNMVKILLFTVQRNGFGGHGITIGGLVIDEGRSKLCITLDQCQNPFGSFLLIQGLKIYY
ncbi:unnamed protein product [Rhizophagus irregularis]|uniref:Uncharacterized protein n=1 Tax=Rhizophagus irregularis TaxID=588596 RepID=A0A915YW31_9GLOM|nr:unnamed protein product [Rhizophagus irregularis]